MFSDWEDYEQKIAKLQFPLTDELLSTILSAISNDENLGFAEERHSAADEILCLQLKSLGFPDSVSVFESMEKWYG
jgi:hypothetical protein